MAYSHEFSWSVDGSPDEVFAALTEPAALSKWFAEHIEVEPKTGGDFRFWGKHTLETPHKAQATQIITAYEPVTRFGFTWTLFGAASEVVFDLAAGEEEGTVLLTGRHTFDSAPTGDRAKELIDDLWRLNNGNFKVYLEGRGNYLLPDYNDASPEIDLSVLIDAPRAGVFKALITPEILAKWIWANAPEVEPRAGGKYSYGWQYEVAGRQVAGGPTKILEFVENEKLVTDWPDWRGDSSVPVQTITWLLSDEGSGTRVRVIHAGFIRPTDLSDYPFGWSDFIQQLKDVVEAD